MKEISCMFALVTLWIITTLALSCDALQMVTKVGVQRPPLQQPLQSSRRNLLTSTTRTALIGLFTSGSIMVSATTTTPLIASADDVVVLTEEEMAARVARKLELQRKSRSGSGSGESRSSASGGDGIPTSAYTADIRSDVNPEAGVDLRSRSFIENTRIAVAKQDEMAKRDKQQKRDDLCEMLGRGC